MGCNVIEMEPASAFRASQVINIPIAAIFSVSDNTVTNKSLVNGRSKQEMDYRRFEYMAVSIFCILQISVRRKLNDPNNS